MRGSAENVLLTLEDPYLEYKFQSHPLFKITCLHKKKSKSNQTHKND